MQPSRNKVLALLVLLYLVWGFNWVIMRVGNDYVSPVFFVTVRFSVGAITLLIVLFARGNVIPPRKYWPWILGSGAMMMCIANVIIQICTTYIGAGLTALLDYMQSVFVCILAVFFLGEKFTLRKVLGIVFCVAGLFILMNIGVTEHIWAIFLTLLAAALWGVSSIIVKSKLVGCDMLQYTIWQMVFGSILLILYLLIGDPASIADAVDLFTGPRGPALFAAAMLIYNGIIPTALAFVLWNYLLTNMEAGVASIAIMGVPAVGVLSGVLVLHEPMSLSIAAGMLLVFFGVLIVLGLGAKQQASE